MKDYKKILQLDSEGKSKNEICQCLGYQWRTVSDILKKAEAAKITHNYRYQLQRPQFPQESLIGASRA